jgi:hypothetical protein
MVNKELYYIVGAPGVGKTTLLDLALDGHRRVIAKKPFEHQIIPSAGVVLLGGHRPPFSGTDTLSMSVLPVVEKWLKETLHLRIIGEGDRLANGRFLNAAADAGFRVTVIHITAESGQVKRRREARAYINKLKRQSEAWAAGRETKAANLASRFKALNVENADDPKSASDMLKKVIGLQ